MATETSILERRAQALARRGAGTEVRASAGHYVLVSVAEHRIGLPVTGVREIVRTPSIAALPNLPAWLPGIVQIRGELLGLVDLTQLYRLPGSGGGELIAVLLGQPGELGILVDRVVGFREVFTDEIAHGRADPASGTGLPTAGTTRDLVLLLEPTRLFEDNRVVVEGRA